MDVNFHVLAEALSALVGKKVILKSELLPTDIAAQLDVTNLPAAVLLSDKQQENSQDLSVGLCEYLTVLVRRLFGRDEVQSDGVQSDWVQSDGVQSDGVQSDWVQSDAPRKLRNSVPTKTPRTKSVRRRVLYVIPEEFFDPSYDCDFTQMSMSNSDSDCTRGNEPYMRPYGWKRFALKVLDKYPDGNAWLGTGGWRDLSDAGEWPVSYHGTNLKGAEGIVKDHYKVGPRNAYGKGIYSTPDIKVADEYSQSKQFISQENGKIYKVIMQNRINPKMRKIIEDKDYWLVPIPEGTSDAKEKETVESSIRPYGILLKEVQEDN